MLIYLIINLGIDIMKIDFRLKRGYGIGWYQAPEVTYWHRVQLLILPGNQSHKGFKRWLSESELFKRRGTGKWSVFTAKIIGDRMCKPFFPPSQISGGRMLTQLQIIYLFIHSFIYFIFHNKDYTNIKLYKDVARRPQETTRLVRGGPLVTIILSNRSFSRDVITV